ncbi:conserved hypothetical protein [Ricinus communis]|uniref:Uncharacterized protein n=1 Tax=Ricinus communis TaxID=3988 RepID=B9RX16_RICCO|nr:conserved hypothetical protein [Ricinus communis]
MSFDGNNTSTNVAASSTNAVNNNTALATPAAITVQLVPTMPYAKSFPDISKIEVFSGQNYKSVRNMFSLLLTYMLLLLP